VRIAFREPTTLAQLPAEPDARGTAPCRFLVREAFVLRLRRPDFLVLGADRHDVLRRNFDVAEVSVPDTWGYVLADTMLLGENVVVLPDGSFVETTFTARAPGAVRPRGWHSDLAPAGGELFDSAILDLEPLEISEPAVLLGTAGASLYHHWLLDVVPKLALLGEAERRELTFAVPAHVPERPLELLGALGVAPDQIVRTPLDRPTSFRRLVVLPRVATATVMLPDVLEELRRQVAAAPDPGATRRLFVARRDAPGGARQLLNEQALAELLGARGYTLLSPSGHGPLEQAALFASAERIVAVHGSGAANVVFAGAEARVLHLHPADAVAFRQHGQLSAARDQPFGYVFGDCFSNPARLHNVEWLVDLEAVERVADEHGF
jgi:hypothetical protein